MLPVINGKHSLFITLPKQVAQVVDYAKTISKSVLLHVFLK